ncbi:nucleoside recognition domain-containing protein [Desulfoscipio geothermicus]|uniref:Nucleoside recognition n=1 Tax=Desulfoscipio geothermicus DSM 3669 TaxID=1121426 RepID=A0A1I6CPA5_9FIRM|nr:nucleoside recognition domain-containing protein [Desulfoscipio geothermicus]SFQ94986.1 Nucleoside recognition [Desulfoscipio geothermicus DSM 3669]
MITAATWKRGLQKGILTTWHLARVIVPVYLVVTLLKYTPVMGWIAGLFAPVMRFFGLPGEASLVLVLGKLLNIYAALGAISSLDLTGREITIIAAILLLSHSLPVESAVSGRTGVSGLLMTALRLIMGVLAGLTVNLFW